MPTPTRLTDAERDRQDGAVRALMHVIPARYRGEDRLAAIRGIGDAVRDYDPSLGKLEAYAARRMRGAVLDEHKWGKRSNVEPFDERTYRDPRYRNSRHDRPLPRDLDIWRTVYWHLRHRVRAKKRGNIYRTDRMLAMRAKSREVLRMIFWDGLTGRETADRLGVNETRVAHLKKYGLAIVRPALKRLIERVRD